MDKEERIARKIARALGHNDHHGMYWERYISAARLLVSECEITILVPGPEDEVAKNGS